MEGESGGGLVHSYAVASKHSSLVSGYEYNVHTQAEP